MFVVVDFFHNFKHLFYSKNVYKHVILFEKKQSRQTYKTEGSTYDYRHNHKNK